MSQVTITAKIGPGDTVTASVIPSPNNINFNMNNNIVSINGVDYDITAASTVTCTKSGSTYTWVVS